MDPYEQLKAAIPAWKRDSFVDPIRELPSNPLVLHGSLPDAVNLPGQRDDPQRAQRGMENIGEGQDVYRDWETEDEGVPPEREQFRRIKSVGEGVPILNPVPTEEVDGEDVEQPYDTLKIRSIRAHPFSQLNVTERDETVEVQGNSVGGAAFLNIGGMISVSDGLVTMIDPGFRGTSGELQFVDCNNHPVYTLTWEDGQITSRPPDDPIKLGNCGATTGVSGP